MRLDKSLRRFYNFRTREAQLERPHCVLLSNCYVCEDGFFHIHFSCLSHHMTSWRESYRVPQDGSRPQAALGAAPRHETICTVHGPSHKEGLETLPEEEEEALECDFDGFDEDLDPESSGPIPR